MYETWSKIKYKEVRNKSQPLQTGPMRCRNRNNSCKNEPTTVNYCLHKLAISSSYRNFSVNWPNHWSVPSDSSIIAVPHEKCLIFDVTEPSYRWCQAESLFSKDIITLVWSMIWKDDIPTWGLTNSINLWKKKYETEHFWTSGVLTQCQCYITSVFLLFSVSVC